ncbi:hypothetical protein FHG87_010147, partial [Trinorchestia longiramus]
FVALLAINLNVVVVALEAPEDDETPLIVPKPVMSFIMGCQKSQSREGLVPVYRTDVSTESGTTSQQVSLLAMDELQESLRAAIESDDVTRHIMSHIKDEFDAKSKPSFSIESCPPTTNVINIDVPPQELEVFHTRMERVMQQNNNILLGLINNMISSKFSSLEQSLSKVLIDRIDKNREILDLLLAKIAPEATERISDSTDEPSKLVDKKQDTAEQQDDPSSSNAFAEIVEAIQKANEQELLETRGSVNDEADLDSTTVRSEPVQEPRPDARVDATRTNLAQLLSGAPKFAI